MASPDPFIDSPLVTPQTTASMDANYSSLNDLVTSAWNRYEDSKRADAEKNALLEVRQLIYTCTCLNIIARPISQSHITFTSM